MPKDCKGREIQVGDFVYYHGSLPNNTIYRVQQVFPEGNLEVAIQDLPPLNEVYFTRAEDLEIVTPATPETCICDMFTVLLVTGCRCGHIDRERQKERNQS